MAHSNMQTKPYFPYRKRRIKRDEIFLVNGIKAQSLFTFSFAEVSPGNQIHTTFCPPPLLGLSINSTLL